MAGFIVENLQENCFSDLFLYLLKWHPYPGLSLLVLTLWSRSKTLYALKIFYNYSFGLKSSKGVMLIVLTRLMCNLILKNYHQITIKLITILRIFKITEQNKRIVSSIISPLSERMEVKKTRYSELELQRVEISCYTWDQQ